MHVCLHTNCLHTNCLYTNTIYYILYTNCLYTNIIYYIYYILIVYTLIACLVPEETKSSVGPATGVTDGCELCHAGAVL